MIIPSVLVCLSGKASGHAFMISVPFLYCAAFEQSHEAHPDIGMSRRSATDGILIKRQPKLSAVAHLVQKSDFDLTFTRCLCAFHLSQLWEALTFLLFYTKVLTEGILENVQTSPMTSRLCDLPRNVISKLLQLLSMVTVSDSLSKSVLQQQRLSASPVTRPVFWE